LTKIECTGQGSCGHNCQNRRFNNKEYADVTVFKTEKKGFGLRANTVLHNGDFIFEYIGEVIDEPRFRRRMRQYDDEGIKHFYFMSLNKGEFVDATKRGNLGRFCNHSCNPNCYVDKWVVGDKLCMGIFAGRTIKPGEELVFNYNVDRYGANPQPCYCGEPNCTGFIGGKTQTERATKLSDATIEALGIEDGDSWDTAVAKKPRRPRKTGEDDEEYVNKLQPKLLQEDGVNNIMATLMQCKEKWIAVKLLNRLQQVDEEKVFLRIVRMHGYRTLKIVLNEFMDDSNVCLQVLGILLAFPRLSRNKIESSGIEDTIEKLKSNDENRVVREATELLELWGQLKMEYRIPRLKRDPNLPAEPLREERSQRRARSRSRSKSRSKSPPSAPAGPRSNLPQRIPPPFYVPSRPAFRRPPAPPALPQGWFEAKDDSGKTYYYNGTHVQWERPTAAAIPAPPPKPLTNEEKLQQIINECIKVTQPAHDTPSVTSTPTTIEAPKQKEEKWQSLPLEKQKKIYENTVQLLLSHNATNLLTPYQLHSHIRPTIDKFKKKLPREDLKRLAKDITKKLVESDYKHKRVSNPAKMDRKYSHAAKQHTADYFNKAVKRNVEKRRREKEADKAAAKKMERRTSIVASTTPPAADLKLDEQDENEDEEIQVSDDEMADAGEEQNATKRKRGSETPATPPESDAATKKMKLAPPPPPPPPSSFPMNDDGSATPKDEAPRQERSPADTNESDHRDFTKLALPNGHRSPEQLATPLTNGSAGHISGH
jgi:histone-lysine N-methyltransferase SETD2